MKKNLSKLRIKLLIVLSLFVLTLNSVSVQEADRNLEMGLFTIAEFQYKELLETNRDNKVYRGLIQALIAQQKYDEVATVYDEIPSKKSLTKEIHRLNGYAHFKLNKFNKSYFYYEKALKTDTLSTLDKTGMGWSAYYLGKSSLAYSLFKDVNNSHLKDSSLNGYNLLGNQKNNLYIELFSLYDSDEKQINSLVSYSSLKGSITAEFNLFKKGDIGREMYHLYGTLNNGSHKLLLSTFYANGDYERLYDGYGALLNYQKLSINKYFNSTMSLSGGYAYFENVSSMQSRFDYGIEYKKMQLELGTSYIYLDYVTRDYDKENVLFHMNSSVALTKLLKLNYQLGLGESDFSFGATGAVYDNYNVENTKHTFGVDATIWKSVLYLRYSIDNRAISTIGLGVGYVI